MVGASTRRATARGQGRGRGHRRAFALGRLLGLALLLATTAAPGARASNDPLRSQQWGLDMVHADQAHATATGRGAVVAVVDTGVSLHHPDLQGRLLPGFDFQSNTANPQDQNGHGTHVAGVIAADTSNGIGVASVAPEAMILPVRVLDADGSGDLGTIAQGVTWAVDHGANVINLSFGGDLISSLLLERQLAEAMDYAIAHNVVVVVSAGNDSLPLCEQPATQGRVLCVAAVMRDGQLASYSSFGLGLAISGPGGSGDGTSANDVLSTYFDPTPGGAGDTYRPLAGTSMATPHVAGVAALLAQVGIYGQAAVDRILATAQRPPGGGLGPSLLYGAGIVDAQAAVAGLAPPPSAATVRPAPSPTLHRGVLSAGGRSGRVRVSRLQRLATVRTRGLVVTCLAVGAGRCSVTARGAGQLLARGSMPVTLGRAVLVRARLTTAGRLTLTRRHRLTVVVRITLPGSPTQVLRVVLTR